MAVDDVFRVARAELRNGPNGTPFPQTLTQTGANRISMTGVYHPDAVGQAPAEGAATAQAFKQQWLGLTDEPDAVPIVSEKHPELSGVYRVRNATVTWKPGISSNGGTYSYTGDFELATAATAPISEIQYAIASRSTEFQSVSPKPRIWFPEANLHTEINGAQPRTNIDGAGKRTIGASIGLGNVGVIGSFRFGTRLDGHYESAARIEVRYPQADIWFPLVGREIPAVVGRDDIRITNGVTRQTFLSSGLVRVERAILDTGVYSWSLIEEFNLYTSDEAGSGALDAPLLPAESSFEVVRNTVESVIVKWVSTSDYSMYVTCTLNRGDAFVTWNVSGLPSTIAGVAANRRVLVEPTLSQTSTTTSNGMRFTPDLNSDGYGWIVLFGGEFEDYSDGRTGLLEGAVGVSFALGSYGPALSNWGAGLMRDQWWGATALTQRFVTL